MTKVDCAGNNILAEELKTFSLKFGRFSEKI